ncbi:MAG: NAD(P)H-dependent glycerol-3-phosphate dehydrogenase [Clostridia bacterium]|nr:NAD(P)H-dependent glycerol-3-phosphate dehydrogenase [Clostridia bacterium]
MKISMIGSGRWGTFIAWYLDQIGHEVKLYGPADTPQMQQLTATRSNGLVTLPDSVKLIYHLSDITDADLIGISVPSQALRGLFGELKEAGLLDKPFVLCMKGIEIETGMRLSEIAMEATGHDRVAVWVGPGHVQEFYRGIPNCMVIDSPNENLKHQLVDAFSGKLIRFYYGNDLIGNEIGAASKNVIGIAAGMLDGLGISSLKGALMARGAREVARLIKAMGGNELSAYGLCHLGDYEATVFSKFSHNRQFGESYVKGETYTDLAEGYYTAKAMVRLGKKYHVELPITNAVYSILYEGVDAKAAISALFDRSIKEEFI